MKYAMIVALVLLGACAPDDADLADEGAPEATTTVQSPLDETSATEARSRTRPAEAKTVKVTATAPLIQRGLDAPVITKVFDTAGGIQPGIEAAMPHGDADKPQPQPWVPPEQEDPTRDGKREETKKVQGTVPGSAP